MLLSCDQKAKATDTRFRFLCTILHNTQLMFLLEECKEYESIISWAADGLSFVIHDIQQFEDQILPKRFKDTKYGSFLRKVNQEEIQSTQHLFNYNDII